MVRTRTPGANSDWLNQLDESQQDNLLDRNEHGLLPHALPNPSRRQLEVEPHPINQNERHEIDFVNEEKEEENLSDRLESEVKPPPVNLNNEERKDDEAISVSEGMDHDNLSHQSESEVKPPSVNLNNEEGKEKDSISASEGIDQDHLSDQSELEVKPPSVNLNNEEGKDMIEKVEPSDDDPDWVKKWFQLMKFHNVKDLYDQELMIAFFDKIIQFQPNNLPLAYACINSWFTTNYHTDLKTWERLDKYLKKGEQKLYFGEEEDDNQSTPIDDNIMDIESIKSPEDDIDVEMESFGEVKPPTPEITPEAQVEVIGFSIENELLEFDYNPKVKPYNEFTSIACVENETDHDTPVVKPNKEQTDIEVIATLSETTTMDDVGRIELHQKHRILKYVMNKLELKANSKGKNSYSPDERLLLLAKDMPHFLIDNTDFRNGMIINDKKVQPKTSQVKPTSIPNQKDSLSKRKPAKHVVDVKKKKDWTLDKCRDYKSQRYTR